MAYPIADVYKAIEELAPAFGVDATTAKIIIGAEQVHKEGSGWKMPTNYSPRPSPVGATGVGQVMPKTQKALIDQGYLPAELAGADGVKGQVAASLAAIKEMIPRTGTDPLRIAAAYNGGTRAGKLYGTPQFSQAPAETQTHVQKAKFVMDQLNPNQSQAETQRLTNAQPANYAPPPSIMQQLLSSFSGVSDTSDKVMDAVRRSQEASDTALSTAKTAVTDQATGANMQAQGAVDAAAIKQGRDEQVTQMFSLTDADVQKNRDQYAMAEAQRLTLEDDINKRLAVGFFDNPLAYLTNLTRLPGLVNEHNALARTTEQLDKSITQRQAHSASQQNVTQANVLEAMRLQEQGKAKETAAKALQQVSELEVNNAATNAKNMMTILNVQSNQMDAGARLMQITRAEMEKNTEFQKLQAKEKEEKVEVSAVNKMLAPIGGAIDERTWKEMTPASKLPMRQMIVRGNYGNSMAEAFDIITGSGLYNRSKADPALVITIDSISDQVAARAREAEAKLGKMGKTIKPEDSRRQALDSLEAEWKESTKAGTDRERLPMGNPLSLDFNGLLLSKQFAGTIAGTVMEKRAKENMVGGAAGLKFDDFAAEALAQVVAKKITPGQAAQQLASFYNEADRLNHEKRGLSMFHIPQADSYTVFAGPAQRELNAKNPAQVEQFLTLRSQAMLQQQIQQQFMYSMPVQDPFGINSK